MKKIFFIQVPIGLAPSVPVMLKKKKLQVMRHGFKLQSRCYYNPGLLVMTVLFIVTKTEK